MLGNVGQNKYILYVFTQVLSNRWQVVVCCYINIYVILLFRGMLRFLFPSQLASGVYDLQGCF